MKDKEELKRSIKKWYISPGGLVVERLPRKQQVAGSNPARGSIFCKSQIHN